jgi:prepilin-type processing-associated H-X9-DG protein
VAQALRNAPGNNPESARDFDARLYAFRHGVTVPKSKADNYRFNAGFFDGHVARHAQDVFQ